MGDEELAGSKDMAYQVYGKDLADQMKGIAKSYRGILEPTGATTQCEKTGHPYRAEMPCYICGLAIPDKSTLRGAADELYPECEHILPLTQARWYLDIYMTTRTPADAWTATAVKLEYDYAHRVCNQAKSMKSFVSPSGTGIVGDATRVKEILRDIAKRAEDNIRAGDDRPRMREIWKAVTETQRERVAAILDVVKPITAHINTQHTMTDPALNKLATLTRAALLADPATLPEELRKLHDRWYADKGPARAAYQEAIATFSTTALQTFPDLSPATFPGLLSARFAASGVDVGPYVTRDVIGRVLETLYVGGVSLTSDIEFVRAFHYGIMQALYVAAAERVSRETPAPTLLQCDLAYALQTVVTEETRAKGSVSLSQKLFGPPPRVDDTQCNRRYNARRRAREEPESPSPPTPAEEATYAEDALRGILKRNAERFGITELAVLKDTVDSLHDDLVTAYTLRPGNDDAAIREIEPELTAGLQMLFLKRRPLGERFIPAVMKDLADFRASGEKVGGKRRRTTYRRKSKRRKTLRKRVRAGVVPK